MTYDVLIAGGGNAALCAAICAAREGTRVLIAEAAPMAMRGGNTRHTRNCRVAHDEGNGILTGPYPVDEYLDDLMRVTKGNTDPELAEMTLQRSKEVWDFLEAQGVRFQPSLGGTLSLGRTNAFFLGGGRSMLNALYRTAEDLGVEVRYETRVVDIQVEDGFFLGGTLEASWETDTPQREEVRARTFVAAAGGFESNIDWLKEGWGEAAENFLIRGTPYNTGGVLRLMLDAGADQIGSVDQFHSVAIDGRAPKFDGGIITRLDCVPFGIVLNENGDRFYDEGEDFWPKRYAIWGRLVAAQPGQVGHVIIDAKSADLFMPSAFPPVIDDTIEGLAAKIGLETDRVRKAVDAFNDACQPGTFDHTIHDDCRTEGLDPPKTHWARPINEPPFQAYTLRPGITFTYMGMRVNRDARVLFDGTPSPNIFATGEIMAGNILGEGYLGGLGMTIGTVFGRIAGEQAAKSLTNRKAAE
ncbi:FAD-dependent tricarballylate dehydrogenase TcuA [Roseobacter weihaiensis]|uniref:FAD-dependent tricarballylate dehydrogenase TcuA n=1 Tax=Roseobacter weihaiensis TaxID=2763262 RepID=UPI001D0B51D8|nr:FAD-dependent tricarballylate dehydrogenase TcuA [Roseobacter sp. H9]